VLRPLFVGAGYCGPQRVSRPRPQAAPGEGLVLTPARTATCSSAVRRGAPFSSCGLHRPGRDGKVAVSVSAGAQAYLGARAAWPFGDMMIDGVPRGAGVQTLCLSRPSSREVLAAVPFWERAARHQGSAGRTRRRARRGSCDRRERVVAEGA